MPQTLEITPLPGPGNTLEIPAIYGQQSILGSPTTITDVYKDYSACQLSVDTACAVVWHDATLGMIFDTSGAPNPDGSVNAGVACDFPAGNCAAACENQQPPGLIQSLIGFFYAKPLALKYPQWFLNIVAQTYPGLVEIGLLRPDWWAWMCTPVLIRVPGFSPSLTPASGGFTCKPPGMVQLVNGVPVCVMDPPTPNPLPWSLRRKLAPSAARPTSMPSSAVDVTTRAARIKALNPTINAGKPFIFKACGCDGPDFEEPISE